MPGKEQGLGQVTDPQLRRVLDLLMRRVSTLETEAARIGSVSQALTQDLQGGHKRVTTIADPTDDLDAVNRRTLHRYVEAAIETALDPLTTYTTSTGGGGSGGSGGGGGGGGGGGAPPPGGT